MPDESINIFTEILNLSLSMEYFPNKFRHADIKPIHKPNKWLPKLLLTVPGKIYEKKSVKDELI